MAKDFRIRNSIVTASIIVAIALFIFVDHQRVQKDFEALKSDLMRIRSSSINAKGPLIVKFKGNQLSVLSYPDGELLDTLSYGTIDQVDYDTTLGSHMIVYFRGTTSAHNKNVHGGEIALRSLLGFNKYIHVNCTGYAEEGRYPEEVPGSHLNC
jgi:hypothetical protein